MQKQKKLVMGVLVIAAVLTVSVVSVYAATHKTGCSSTMHTVECVGPYNYTQFGYHVLYSTANGQVNCIKTAMHGAHRLYCANSQCGVLLETTSRTHAIEHEYCPTETGVCQY